MHARLEHGMDLKFARNITEDSRARRNLSVRGSPLIYRRLILRGRPLRLPPIIAKPSFDRSVPSTTGLQKDKQ
jgi:hypothetical protein